MTLDLLILTGTFLNELFSETLQYSTGRVDRDIFCGVEPADYRQMVHRPITSANDQGQLSILAGLPLNIKNLGAINLKRLAGSTRFELQRHNAHADQIGSMYSLQNLQQQWFQRQQGQLP